MDIPPERWDDVRRLIPAIRTDWDVELAVPPPGDAIRFSASRRTRESVRAELAKALGISVNDGLPAASQPPDADGDPVDIPPELWGEVQKLIAQIRSDWNVDLIVPPPGDAIRFTAAPKMRASVRADLSHALGIDVNDGMPRTGVSTPAIRAEVQNDRVTAPMTTTPQPSHVLEVPPPYQSPAGDDEDDVSAGFCGSRALT